MAKAIEAPGPPKESGSGVAIPIGIICIVLMMVMPVPAFLLDFLLAISLAIAVGVFLTALFIEKALDYSVFPAIVLVATLLRLSLNVASTRLILLHGAEGQGGAGRVIETFGRFVVGGNVVVGLVVFLILVVINFVVITKGAGRVAEVAARFTLDAMPGKQMAIDADLNGGLITPDAARERRRSVEQEADFYGAMDGASKFVHGDAIAGIIITVINLVGGLLRGLISGMDVSTAVETFSILSVGDALVAQVPALLISTASGIVVTRSAAGGELGEALGRQLLGSRRAVGLTAGVLTLFAMIPGMPALPFLGLATALAVHAFRQSDADKAKVAAALAPPPPKANVGKSEEIESALPLDVLALEVGYELIPAVEATMGGTLIDRIGALRRQFALDMGVIVPPVRVRDNLQIGPSEYRFVMLGTELARGKLRTGRLMTMGTVDAPELKGEKAPDPIFGTPALWIRPSDRDVAEALGCTVVDHATVMATHLGELVRTHCDQLLGRQELQHLLDVFSKGTPKLVEDVVPSLLSLGDVLKVMRNLLREGISIRDLRSIVEALAETATATKDTEQLTELVRQRLSRQLTSANKNANGVVPAMVLDPHIEEVFRRSLREIAGGTGGALDPDEVRRLGQALEAAAERQRRAGNPTVIVTSPDLRRYVRAFVERRCPQVAVLSFREIESSATIRPVETISVGPKQ